jgi:hypothetical protein
MKYLAIAALITGIVAVRANSAATAIPSGVIQAVGIRNSGDPNWDNKVMLKIANKQYYIRSDLENGPELLSLILTAYEKNVTVYGFAELGIVDGEGRAWIVFLNTGL